MSHAELSILSFSPTVVFLSLRRCFKGHLIEVIYVSSQNIFLLVAKRKSFECFFFFSQHGKVFVLKHDQHGVLDISKKNLQIQ